MDIEILEIIPRAIMVGVAASITVGPVAILTIQRTLSRGREAGVLSGFGIATADTILAFVAYLFYSLIRNQIAEHSYALKIGGGLLVIVMGAMIMMKTPAMHIRQNRSAKRSSWRDFISIFGLTLANFIVIVPYILAFFALFRIKPIEYFRYEDLISGLLVIIGFFAGSSMWWFCFVSCINRVRRRFKPRHIVIINRLAGALIILLGVITLTVTFFHILPNEF